MAVLAAAVTFSNVMVNRMPCLTASRGVFLGIFHHQFEPRGHRDRARQVAGLEHCRHQQPATGP
eukprot:2330157-Lingulodinium_polyedra.AAC.1